jgi:DNA polymerase-4
MADAMRGSGDDDALRPWTGRAVLHVDMDAFFASVEQLDHPEWRGKPLIVGGSAESRGVVATCSYEARVFGVRSAMPSATARRLCPDAIWARGSFDRYREVSRKVFDIFRDHTPSVQAASIDEAYLDVTPGEHGEHPVVIARAIQAEVAALGVTCSVGLASGKTVAKIASDRDKPRGLTIVWPGEEATFLAPLPVGALPGIGPKSAQHLVSLGLRTLGGLATLDDATALQVMGSHGPSAVRRARGIDSSGVHDRDPVKSVSNERTFPTDLRTPAEVEGVLTGLAEHVSSRLRAGELAGRTVTVKVRFADFTTRTVQRTLDRPADLPDTIGDTAVDLLRTVWNPGVGVRLLGVGVSGFEDAALQLDLFGQATPEDDDRRRAVARSVDAVRERFGDEALSHGAKRIRPRTVDTPKPFGEQD